MKETPSRTVRSLLLVALALGACPAALAQRPADDGADPSAPARQRGGADPSDDAFRMGSPPALPDGLTEEDMWPAATAEGWKKPCLVRWQRTFEDAMRVARAEQRPILVAVNMDGEIASEHFAGVRYRQPATAALLNRYACVVASVYRHTPRDYDENGGRVECPRFGTVTCGEHIEAERQLYEVYFDGQRVAPRHIVLDLDGSETYDVYFAWNTDAVYTTFRKGIEGWPDPVEPVEPTLDDLVASADVDDRLRVERAYVEGDRGERREILEELLEEREVEHVEVVRSALFGFDLELAQLARRVLAGYRSDGALEVMAAALNSPLSESERELLLSAVEELAGGSARAHALAAVHSGLTLTSPHIASDSVRARAAEYEANAARSVDVDEIAAAAETRPEEPEALLELAEALLARADETEPRFATLLAEDARAAARDAEKNGASGPRLDAVLAITSARLGDLREARERAVAAVEGGLLTEDSTALEGVGLSDESRVRLLWLFAQTRQRAVRDAFRAGDDWPPEWLSDVNAAYASIAEQPLTSPAPLIDFHDFLRWLGAHPRASTVLDDALARFPDSTELHERLRDRLLWQGGPEALEREYAERVAREAEAGDGATQITWFAGYGSLVAAEHLRRRGRFEEALAAYERGIAHYRHNIELFPEAEDVTSHWIALAHAGRARVLLERRELRAAADELVAALELRPGSSSTQDGLGITPIATAKMIKARCLDAGDTANATRVQDALDRLDPELLEPPPSELQGSARRGRPRAGR